jgi:hypothetical protein
LTEAEDNESPVKGPAEGIYATAQGPKVRMIDEKQCGDISNHDHAGHHY